MNLTCPTCGAGADVFVKTTGLSWLVELNPCGHLAKVDDLAQPVQPPLPLDIS